MDQDTPDTPEPGTDTATGTDPDAKYEQPGYEDKSFGQAVDADAQLAEEIAAEEDDPAAAEERFEEFSPGLDPDLLALIQATADIEMGEVTATYGPVSPGQD